MTHAVSVGEPLREEGVRGIMLMVLQNLGRGNSGVRLEILEMYREFLNKGITPKVPEAGSVGYLALERIQLWYYWAKERHGIRENCFWEKKL